MRKQRFDLKMKTVECRKILGVKQEYLGRLGKREAFIMD